MPEPAAYPRHWEADVVLKDGKVAHLRPIRPEDAAGLNAFHDAQSAESTYLRFFAPLPHLSDRDVARFTQVDYVDRVGLVALLGEDIVGVGRYDRVDATSAEVAFNISDAHQGRGLGSVLLEHLAAAARERGVRRFVAEVLPQNRKMMTVFLQAGYEVRHGYEDGVILLDFDISPTQNAARVREAREHRAESLSMRGLLHPRSVVVVGATHEPDSVGRRVIENLLAADFVGLVHVVGDEAFEEHGVSSHRRVSEVPGPVDLAVVTVPAELVPGVVADCAASGVRGLVVLGGGFAEAGDDGRARQRELVRLAHAHGMRVVGPNSFGVVNNDPFVQLNASLAPTLPPAGGLGLFSQSGALAIAVLDSAARRGLGVSTFVSAGNRADVSGNDVMQYWVDDPSTDAVGMYLESMGNPRKFSRIARRLARRKPVVVLMSGVSSFSVPPGHAVRQSRLPREAMDQMMRQSGVMRVETVHQLFDVAQLVAHQPLPAGPRVAVVTNSDALGALAGDACASWGLEVLRPAVTVAPNATAGEFREALEGPFSGDQPDSVVVCFVPPLVTLDTEVAKALAEVAAASDKTCVATFLGMHGATAALSSSARTVPAYPTPEDSVRALASATRYSAWRRRDRGDRVHPADLDRDGARSLVLSRTPPEPAGAWLSNADSTALLAAYGIRLWQQVAVSSVEQALAAADQVGYPVALKATAEHLRHRVDLGGVRLGLESPGQLREALTQQQQRLGPLGGSTFVVQAMAPTGLACVVRTTEDPLFGPVVEFGVGGAPSELLGDVGRRFPPLREGDVADLVRSVRAAPLLFGHRGSEPVDVGALEDLLARLSVLADDLPQVAFLELNPVVVGVHGLAVLDAGIRLAEPPGRTDTDVRRLLG